MKRMVTSGLMVMMLVLIGSMVTMRVHSPTDHEHVANLLSDIEIKTNQTAYRTVFSSWLDEGLNQPQVTDGFTVDDMITDAALVMAEDHQAFQLEKDDTVEIPVVVDEDGLYEIWLDYLVLGDRTTNPGIKKEIRLPDGDHQVQYNEDSDIRLPITWVNLTEEPSVDRYGDEIPIRAINSNEWAVDVRLFDPAGLVKTPLKNRLNAGLNIIRLTLVNTVDFYIKGITVTNSDDLLTYDQYLDQYINQGDKAAPKTLITANAEDYVAKSATSVTVDSLMKPHMSSYQFNRKLLNHVIIKKAGQWVEYEVDVPDAGLYDLSIKGEMTNRGLPVFRKITINGSVPFEAFNHLMIDYAKGWANHTLGGDTPYQVYLEQGINTIRIEASPGLYTHFEALQGILDDIQDLAILITSLTGGLADTSRTWDIVSYIPDISERLSSMADRLIEEYDKLISYSDEPAAQFNVLKIAAEQLMVLAEKPDDIVEKSYLLNVGSSSSANLIAAALTGLLEEPMAMDRLYVHSGEDLPRATSPWYVNLFESIKMFVYSFFDPRYDIDLSDDPEVVKVWVSKSKLHVDVMQRMVDELFTPETGIDVELIVLQNANRIVLANAAGKTPDVALTIGAGSVFDYASRGMLANLAVMDGFQMTASDFNPNTFVPYIYEDGVYGMPETQDVALLFYRKDILESLDLFVPDTWDDVIGMLPLLQSLGMNFYHPISSSAATKSINHMSPLIYQYGAEFFGETATDVSIRDPKTVEAIKFMIDLYNVYNLPLQIGSFYDRFRNGTLPIGIGDQNMYIQLKYAAPELIGQWGVAPIPGMMSEDGEVLRYDTALGAGSIIFEASSNKENAWSFLQWWNSAEIQSEFSHELIANFGDLFLYMTANIKGFETSSWPEDSKDAILEQWTWIRIPPKLPGYYILEREISNVYNKAVFEQTNYRSALDDAYFNIIREINRKLDEFGYTEENPYVIPNNANIDRWIGGS